MVITPKVDARGEPGPQFEGEITRSSSHLLLNVVTASPLRNVQIGSTL